jgi:hypothetical protein
MEVEIARGENPYADFFQTAKSEDWREEAQKGTLLTKTKEKVEKNAGIFVIGSLLLISNSPKTSVAHITASLLLANV